MIFNNSRFSTWQMCRRKYYWRYVLGLEGSGKSDALAFGTAIHEALEAYYHPDKEVSVEGLQQIFTNTYVTLGNPLILDEYEPNKVMGPKLIMEYIKRDYLKDDFGVVQTESTFLVPLGDRCYACGHPYMGHLYNGPKPQQCPKCHADIIYLAGRTDLITTRNNNYEVIDHKTAASTGKYYYDKYGHHFGMIGYAYGVEKTLNYRVFKYGLNVFKKLKTAGKDSKVCPDCRNGKVKRLACMNKECMHTGHVPMEPVRPFERHYYRVTPEYYDMMIANRIRIAKDIAAEEHEFHSAPEISYPMSCESCDSFKGCPYTNLCWENEDHPWWEPPEVLLADFKEQPDDYVDDMNTLAREEMY